MWLEQNEWNHRTKLQLGSNFASLTFTANIGRSDGSAPLLRQLRATGHQTSLQAPHDRHKKGRIRLLIEGCAIECLYQYVEIDPRFTAFMGWWVQFPCINPMLIWLFMWSKLETKTSDKMRSESINWGWGPFLYIFSTSHMGMTSCVVSYHRLLPL